MIGSLLEGVTWLGVVLGMIGAMAWGSLYYSPVTHESTRSTSTGLINGPTSVAGSEGSPTTRSAA